MGSLDPPSFTIWIRYALEVCALMLFCKGPKPKRAPRGAAVVDQVAPLVLVPWSFPAPPHCLIFYSNLFGLSFSICDRLWFEKYIRRRKLETFLLTFLVQMFELPLARVSAIYRNLKSFRCCWEIVSSVTYAYAWWMWKSYITVSTEDVKLRLYQSFVPSQEN